MYFPGSEYGYERAEGNNQKPPKERLPEFNIQNINQQPLHRGGRSNPNQCVLNVFNTIGSHDIMLVIFIFC